MPAKSDPLAAWRKHVQKFRSENPGLDLKTALTMAKETYQVYVPAGATLVVNSNWLLLYAAAMLNDVFHTELEITLALQSTALLGIMIGSCNVIWNDEPSALTFSAPAVGSEFTIIGILCVNNAAISDFAYIPRAIINFCVN